MYTTSTLCLLSLHTFAVSSGALYVPGVNTLITAALVLQLSHLFIARGSFIVAQFYSQNFRPQYFSLLCCSTTKARGAWLRRSPQSVRTHDHVAHLTSQKYRQSLLWKPPQTSLYKTRWIPKMLHQDDARWIWLLYRPILNPERTFKTAWVSSLDLHSR